MLGELDETLHAKVTMTAEAREFLRQLRRHIRMVDVAPLPVQICRDPDDDVVLATAVAAGAEVIVTGDDGLLVLGSHQGVAIRSPRRFLEALAIQP